MRYVVEQLPTRGWSAFTPTLTRPGIVATRGLTHIVGWPGTEPVPSPAPGLPIPSFDPRTSNSNNAPDAIAPDVYVALADNMGPFAPRGAFGTRYSDNEQPPVIQGEGHRTANPAAQRQGKFGGRKTIGWPRATQSYPPVAGTGGGT